MIKGTDIHNTLLGIELYREGAWFFINREDIHESENRNYEVAMFMLTKSECKELRRILNEDYDKDMKIINKDMIAINYSL